MKYGNLNYDRYCMFRKPQCTLNPVSSNNPVQESGPRVNRKRRQSMLMGPEAVLSRGRGGQPLGGSQGAKALEAEGF